MKANNFGRKGGRRGKVVVLKCWTCMQKVLSSFYFLGGKISQFGCAGQNGPWSSQLQCKDGVLRDYIGFGPESDATIMFFWPGHISTACFQSAP